MIQQRIVNNSFTEIYVEGGGNWITQSFPTNFHTFERKHILDKGESIDDWREVSDSEKAALEKADAEWVEPSEELIARWKERGNYNLGRIQLSAYNRNTGFFSLNEIYDISTQEAIMILEASAPKYAALNAANQQVLMGYAHVYTGCRTLFPTSSDGSATQYNNTFMYESQLINISFVNGYGNVKVRGVFTNTFYSCPLLERILTPLTPTSNVLAGCFSYCKSLYELKLDLDNNSSSVTSIDISAVSLWSLESAQYTVQNKTCGQAITITVHADVYAKLTDEGNTEWHKVWQDAQDKQISFATS